MGGTIDRPMAIELYFSNQLDQLASRFSENLLEDRNSKEDPFDAPVVIIPNANLARWLQLFLAEKNGICMHIDFRYLEEGLWEMLSALDSRRNRPEMLDIDALKILLLRGLQGLNPVDEDYSPITRYLYGQDAAPGPGHAARLWQLSEKLAHLYKEYEFHRADMIHRWLQHTSEARGMERCQQRLYRQVQTLRDRLEERTGKRLESMTEYADFVFSRCRPDAGTAMTPRTIHFFGLSQISAFHLTLIGRLQAFFDIGIYAVNPCEAFWEDLRTPGEERWFQRKKVEAFAIDAAEQDRGELFAQPDNPLLAAWGKPGRESIRLLCQLTGYDFHACFPAARRPKSVLQSVQDSILTLSGGAESNRFHQDRSLQIVACPSRYREVETVYNSILYSLSQDDSLQLTDIAILVPDISAYKPVFDSVFNRRPKRLLYNLVDSRAEIESVYGKAVLAILHLATSRFSRSAVFDLMLNPCFMSRWRIDLDDVHAWARWARALNIFHTFDRPSKIARGYPPSGTFTWKQGLQRLRLARILAAPDMVDASGFAHYRDLVPYADLKTGEPDRVETFCRVVETLHQSVAALNTKQAGGGRWKDLFLHSCDSLLEIPAHLEGEGVVRQELIRSLDRLTTFEQLGEDGDPPGLNTELIEEYIRANLKAISGGQGSYLTGGVTISALQPMRPIPFQTVHVLGMEEGGFPGKADVSTLDLRKAKRRIGDISIPERNAYLFLEMLLSVREKLVISYVARDLQRDRRLEPCSVVNQLVRYLEQAVLPEGSAFQLAEIPLSGSSPRHFGSDAVNDWSDVLVNDSLADRVAFFRTHGLWEAFRQRAGAGDVSRVARFHPDFSFDRAAGIPASFPEESITTSHLRKFLENPVRCKLQRHLGLYDEEETIEDVALDENEPFFSGFPVDYYLRTEPIKRWLNACFFLTGEIDREPEPEDFFDPAYEDCRRRGHTPEGAFAQIDKHQLQEDVKEILEAAKPVLERMRAAKRLLRAVVIGQPAEDVIFPDMRLPVKRFSPVALRVEARRPDGAMDSREALLHGHLPWVWQEADGSWHTLILTGSGKKPKEPDRYVLAPFLFHLLSRMGDESRRWFRSPVFTFHIVYRQVAKQWRYAIEPETAKPYLASLVSDLLDPDLAAWMPFERGARLSVQPHKLRDAEVNESLRRAFAAELAEAAAEEPDELVRLAKPGIPPDAFDKFRRRFQPVFEASGTESAS